MKLTNSQYDQLMLQYNERKNRAIEDLDDRKEKLYKALPALKELEARARRLSMAYVREAGQTDAAKTAAYEEEMDRLGRERDRLLREHGWDASYLEPKYECPDCQDTGFVNGKKCHCMKKQAIRLFYKQSHLGDAIKKESFDLFDLSLYPDDKIDELTGMTSRDTMKDILGVARHFVRTFDSDFQNLLLYGDTGVGKTFLSHCIAHELLDTGHSVLYLDAIRFFEILEARQFDRELGFSDKDALLSYLLDSELLIIDDLGTEMTNGFTTTQLYHVIEGRLLRERSTIISTNLSIRDLNELYSERVFSRIMHNFQNLRLIGDDIRLMGR